MSNAGWRLQQSLTNRVAPRVTTVPALPRVAARQLWRYRCRESQAFLPQRSFPCRSMFPPQRSFPCRSVISPRRSFPCRSVLSPRRRSERSARSPAESGDRRNAPRLESRRPRAAAVKCCSGLSSHPLPRCIIIISHRRRGEGCEPILHRLGMIQLAFYTV